MRICETHTDKEHTFNHEKHVIMGCIETKIL